MTWNALPQIYTTKEAARALRVSHRTLEDWRLKGGGPPFNKNRTGRSLPTVGPRDICWEVRLLQYIRI